MSDTGDDWKLHERRLRTRAEVELGDGAFAYQDNNQQSAEQLLHELQVHQIELEMQNEELRQAHIALEESRDRYMSLYEFAPVGYLTLNTDGIIIEANLTGATLLGIERGKLLQRVFAQFVAVEERERWYAHFLAVKKQGEKCQGELTLRHADGSCLPTQIDCLRIDSDDARSVLRLTLTDISLRKHAESALRDSETRLSLTVEGAELATWDWDINKGRILVNERWATMRGYELTEINPTIDFWRQGIFFADLPAIQQALTEYFEGHTPIFTAEYRIRNKSGALIWLLNRSTTIQFDVDGKPLRMVGIELNITQRKQAEERLRIAAAAFETQSGIVVTDSDGYIMRVNQAFSLITGYAGREVTGQKLTFLHSGLHDDDFYQAIWAALIGNGYWQGEICDKHKNGELLPIYLTISAIKDEVGYITHYVGSYTDITAQKQAESVLLEARQKLESQVASTTEELEKIRLDSEKINSALNVLLKYRENDKNDAQGTLAREMAGTVMPFLKKLKTANSGNKNQTQLLAVLEDNLQQLVKFYGSDTSLSNVYRKLTPTEIQIASMVRQGLSSKIIASTLHLSAGTVDIHRKHIRKKLDLDSKAINLYSYLQSMTE